MKLTYKLYHTVCHPSIAYTSDPTFPEFYFSKPEMAYTYLAEYSNGAIIPEHMKYSDSPTFTEMYEKWKKYRKSLHLRNLHER